MRTCSDVVTVPVDESDSTLSSALTQFAAVTGLLSVLLLFQPIDALSAAVVTIVVRLRGVSKAGVARMFLQATSPMKAAPSGRVGMSLFSLGDRDDAGSSGGISLLVAMRLMAGSSALLRSSSYCVVIGLRPIWRSSGRPRMMSFAPSITKNVVWKATSPC